MISVSRLSLRFIVVGLVALALGAPLYVSSRAHADDIPRRNTLSTPLVDMGSLAIAGAPSIAFSNINSGALFDNMAPTTLSIFHSGQAVIVIGSNGTVTLAKGASYTKGARAFWQAVDESNPLRSENERLRRQLAACGR